MYVCMYMIKRDNKLRTNKRRRLNEKYNEAVYVCIYIYIYTYTYIYVYIYIYI